MFHHGGPHGAQISSEIMVLVPPRPRPPRLTLTSLALALPLALPQVLMVASYAPKQKSSPLIPSC